MKTTRPSRTKTKKICPFHYRGLECKSRKSRGTWSNRQVRLWSTKWSSSKANRVLSRESLIIANTLFRQHKRWLYTCTWPHGQYWNQIDYTFCKWSWKSSIQSANTRPGAACGSHYELFIVKLRLKLKKLGKVNKPFKYDLNKIPSDYSVEETNRFKGLGLVDRVPEELWTEAHDIIQEAVSRTIPRKKECKKAKWLSEEVLHIAEERRGTKSEGERERYTQLNTEFQRIIKRDKKAFFNEQWKEENNRIRKTSNLFI